MYLPATYRLCGEKFAGNIAPLGLPQSSPVFDAKLRYNSVPNPRRACIPWHISRESPASTRNLTEDIHQKCGVTMPWMGHISLSLCWSLRLWTNQVGCRFIISPRARLDHLQSGLVQACTQKPRLKCKPKRNKQPPWWSPELLVQSCYLLTFRDIQSQYPPVSSIHAFGNFQDHLIVISRILRLFEDFEGNIYRTPTFHHSIPWFPINKNPSNRHQSTSTHINPIRPHQSTGCGCAQEAKLSLDVEAKTKVQSHEAVPPKVPPTPEVVWSPLSTLKFNQQKWW